MGAFLKEWVVLQDKRHWTRISQIDTKREKQRHCSRKAAKNAEERQKRNLATDFPGQKAPRTRRREECKGKILRFMNYDLGIMNYENFLNNCEIYE